MSERSRGDLRLALGFLARANHEDLATVDAIAAVTTGIATDMAKAQEAE